MGLLSDMFSELREVGDALAEPFKEIGGAIKDEVDDLIDEIKR